MYFVLIIGRLLTVEMYKNGTFVKAIRGWRIDFPGTYMVIGAAAPEQLSCSLCGYRDLGCPGKMKIVDLVAQKSIVACFSTRLYVTHWHIPPHIHPIFTPVKEEGC